MSARISLADLARHAHLANLVTFAPYASKGTWKPFRHLKYLCRKIDECIEKENGRLLVFMPPRHGKSYTISHMTPMKILENDPSKRVVLASYEANFAESWGAKVRDNFMEDAEKDPKERLFSLNLGKRKLANWWETTEGGGMATAGVGGPLTGKGFDVGIIDDVLKNWQEAMSPTIRSQIIDWYNSVFYTRREPGASIIVLMTRWHEEDLGGYLLEESVEDWDVVRLPALAEEDDPLGRKIGEALCPERYDQYDLDITRRQDKRIWEAMYQQRPAAAEGGLVLRSWWKIYGDRPAVGRIIQSWDCTFSKSDTSDYVVGQVWGQNGQNYYLLDQIREKLSFNETENAILTMLGKWPGTQNIVIENKANGPAIVSRLQHNLHVKVEAYNPQGSKESRVQSVSPMIEQGQVHLPSAVNEQWVGDFINEWAMWPAGKHDDQIDACTQALDYLRGSSYKIQFSRARKRKKVLAHNPIAIG